MKRIYIFIFCVMLFFANLHSMQPDIKIELQTLQQELLVLESVLHNQSISSTVERILSSMREASKQFQHQTSEIKKNLKDFEIFIKSDKELSIKEMKESELYKKIEQGVDELEPMVSTLKADLEKLVSHDNLNLDEIIKIKRFLKKEIRNKMDEFVMYFREVSTRGSKTVGMKYIIRPLDPIENKHVYVDINYAALEGQKERASGITTFREGAPLRKKTFIEMLDEYFYFLKNKKKALEHLIKK